VGEGRSEALAGRAQNKAGHGRGQEEARRRPARKVENQVKCWNGGGGRRDWRRAARPFPVSWRKKKKEIFEFTKQAGVGCGGLPVAGLPVGMRRACLVSLINNCRCGAVAVPRKRKIKMPSASHRTYQFGKIKGDSSSRQNMESSCRRIPTRNFLQADASPKKAQTSTNGLESSFSTRCFPSGSYDEEN